MDWSHVLAFNIALVVAILVPGPSLLYLTHQTLKNGRATGIATALGLGVTSALWTVAALAGLDSLFRVFPWAYVFLKTAGACYLIWIAVKTWRSAKDDVSEREMPKARSAFVGGLLVNLANPKAVLFAGAVILVIFPPTITLGDKAFIVFNQLAVEWIMQPFLAVLLSTAAVRRGYMKLKSVFDRVSAVILGGLGVRLLFDQTK